MPLYEYECLTCGEHFEARHGFNDPMPPCPHGHTDVRRLITSAPRVMKGMAALASKNADKGELQSKWQEETPKMRQKLVDRLGEDMVRRHAPSLGLGDASDG
jgi:putative FmdB family regulatory protein